MRNTGKLAVIGGGMNSAIGSTHIIASQMDNRWKVAAGAFSRDSLVNHSTGDYWGITSGFVFASWQEMMDSNLDVDAYVVLTPTPTHFEIASLLLNEGKNVICEKALTVNSKEAFELQKIANQNDAKLFVTFNYTGYPLVREMKNGIENGKLGKISSIQIQMPQEGFARIDSKGNPILPQPWRQEDGKLSTLSLDLGVHVVNLIHFLTNEFPVRLVATKSHHGLVPNVVDYVSCIAETANGVDINLWYGKSHIGKRNGLEVTVTGSQGSYRWVQSDPETLLHSINTGEVRILDRASPAMDVSLQPRYTRFKAGHPAGFIEAFSNYYFDIADELLLDKPSRYCFDALEAAKGLEILETIETSATEKSWLCC
jgi:predicted dehydrogenase